ncbi:MAG: aminoacyl-tRNA hydrolase, partial [Thiomonas sp.]
MIQLLVGLGNPGPEHALDRHNAGFWLVDQVATAAGVSLKPERGFFGDVARVRLHGHELWLLEPSTYMNRSGQSVGAFARFYKIPPENILVAHDELDLPPGQAKLKLGGGHAGHNGLRDLVAHLGTPNFWRLRLGIGHPGDRSAVVGFVLGKPPQAELRLIEQALEQAQTVLPQLLEGHFEAAMMQLHRANRQDAHKPSDGGQSRPGTSASS